MTSDYHRIERAIRYLANNAEAQPSLRKLADQLGLSEYHCHRLFKKWVGITPKNFLQALTLSKAKDLLRGSNSVLDASLSVGLSGSSRLHDLFVRFEAMTPGEYKNRGAALEIHWSHAESPLGAICVGATSRGICSLSFAGTAQQAFEELRQSWPEAKLLKNTKLIRPLADEIRLRMSGSAKTPLSVVMKGTPFQLKVWKALLRIPEGERVTYQDLAAFIGSPQAVRAVGSAVGANPIGYLIPCHRVIRSTGVIGDYHWGPARKAIILAMERGRKVQELSRAIKS